MTRFTDEDLAEFHEPIKFEEQEGVKFSSDDLSEFETNQETDRANLNIEAKTIEGINPQQHVSAYDEAKESGVDTTTVINAEVQPAPRKIRDMGEMTSKFLGDNRGNAMFNVTDEFNFLEQQYRNKQQQEFSHTRSFGTGQNLSFMQLGVREAKLQRSKIEPLRSQFWGNGSEKDQQTINSANTQMSMLRKPEGLFEDVVAASSGEVYDLGADIEQAKYGIALASAIKIFTPAGKAWSYTSALAGAGTLTAVGAEQEMLYFFEDLNTMTDKNGKRLDTDIARGVSAFYGLTSGMLENIPALRAFGRVVPEAGVFGKFTKKQFKDKLKQPSVRAAFKRFGKNFTQGMAEESFTEIFQQLTQDLSKNVMLVATGDDYDWAEKDFVSLNELGANMKEAGIEALKGGVGIQGGISGVGLRNDIKRARESQERLDAKQAIFEAQSAEGVKSTGTVGKEFADETGKDTGSQGNFIQPEHIEKFFQETGLTDDEIASKFPLTSQAIYEAKELDDGAEINVPDHEFQEFYESDAADDIMNNYRESQDGLTRAEVITLNEQINEAMEQEPEKSAIYEDVYGQLKGMGATDYVARQQALLWDSMIRTRARRHNISPEDMYEQSKLDVSEEDMRLMSTQDNYERLDSLLDMMRAGQEPTERQAYGASIMEFLTAEGGLQDEGGELSARDVGRVGTKNLIQAQEKGGITLDEAIERLVENGYFGGETADYMHEDVLDAIDEELSGVPAYAEERAQPEAKLLKEEVEAIRDHLDKMGIDVADMTNQEIKAELEKQALFQPAYHGTHAKGIEEFLTKYVSTGEGAQAYGWGLYFADDKGIAEWYKRTVSERKIIVDGKQIPSSFEDPYYSAAYDIKDKGYKQSKIDAEAETPESEEDFQFISKYIVHLEELKDKEITTAGQVYKVDLKPKEDDYLYWDKPMSEQSDKVQDAVISMGLGSMIETETGQSFYNKLTSMNVGAPDKNWMVDRREGQKKTSLELLDAGVRGMKYSDAATRGKEGEQSYNYVIFDDRDVEITETFYQKETYYDKLDDRQKEVVEKQIDLSDNPERLRKHLSDFAYTPWAKQAIQAALLREAMDLYGQGKGEQVDFDSLMTTTKNSKLIPFIKAIQAGDSKMLDRIEANTILGHASKPLNEVDGSFLNCNPSKGCATFCYAVKGQSGMDSSVFKSELTDWYIRNNPTQAAEMTARQYKSTPEFYAGKALRFFERGDAGKGWVEFTKKLNELGVRAHVFSKKPEFLKEISEDNLRLLSIDATNKEMVTENPELDVAIVWTGVHDNVMLTEAGVDRVQVVLKPKNTKGEVPAEFKKDICPVEGKGLSIGKKKGEWNCSKCDSRGGLACYKGKSTEHVMTFTDIIGKPKAGKFDAQINQLKKLGKDVDDDTLRRIQQALDSIISDAQQGTYDDPEETVREGVQEGVGRTGRDRPDVEGKLFQRDKDAKGYYERAPLRDVFRITLTGKADLSTFLHESGHAFLDMLIKDAEQFDDAKQELDILMKWMNVDSIDQIDVKQHEQFARGFEAYLRTGKAPSIELKEAFRNFKLWLKNIYRQMRQLNVTLNSDVTGVMDRMLASQEEIEDARTAAGILPMYDELSQIKDAGMSREAYDEYRQKYNSTMAANLEALDAARITAYNKQVQFMNKERRKKAEAQAVENISQKYGAHLFLKNKGGKVLPDVRRADGQKVFTYSGKNRKLSKESVQRVFPKVPADRLRGLYSKENGVDADMIAGEFGYASGADMVNELANQPPYKEALTAETARILKDEYGEQEIIPTAKEVVHSDTTTDFIKAELKTLGKRAGVMQQIKMQAKQRIRETVLAQVKPIIYERAERKASVAAAQALANGDRITAALEKQKQLLNHHLFKEATRALTNADKYYRYLKKFEGKAKRKKIGLAGEAYLNSIDLILETIQLKRVTNKFLDRKKALKRYIKTIHDERMPVDEKLLAMVADKNYREMTVEEFAVAYEAVKNIDGIASNKKKWLDKRNKKDFDEKVDSVSATIRNNKPKLSDAKNIRNKVRGWFRKWDASLIKIEFITRWFDGGEMGGYTHNEIFVPFQEAEAKQMDMNIEYTKKIMEIISQRGKSWKGSTMFMGQEMDKSEVVAAALNVGNEGNLQRLVDGYKWNYQQMMDELELQLNKEDWDAIQEIWNTIDELYAPMSDIAQRVEGERPAKVEAVPFKAHGKTYKGGYYPAVYDPEKTIIGRAQTQDVGAKAFITQHVKGSAAKKREDTVFGAISLDLNQLPRHIHETIFYITHYEPVANISRLINDQRVVDAIVEHYGFEHHQAITDWLDAIAKEGLIYNRTDSVEEFIEYVRTGTSISAMGASITTGLVQPLGLFNTMMELGKLNTLNAMRQVSLNPVKTWKKMNEDYPEFKHLMNMFDRELKQNMKREITGGKIQNIHDLIKNKAFLHIGAIQKVVNMITYQAAQNKYMNDDSLTANQAINKIKASVRQTQSMAGQKDLAAIQRGKVSKLLVMFYSYFSVMYAQMRTRGRVAGKTKMQWVSQNADMLAMLVILPSVLDTWARGYCEEEDDEAACYGKYIGLYSVAPLPVARDIISYAFGDYGYSFSPVGNTLKKMTDAGAELFKDDTDIEKVLKGVAPILHLPSKVMTQTINLTSGENDEWREWLQLKRPE